MAGTGDVGVGELQDVHGRPLRRRQRPDQRRRRDRRRAVGRESWDRWHASAGGGRRQRARRLDRHAPDAVVDTIVDAAVDTGPDVSKIAPPRLIAPLSTATVTSRRPLLHWVLPGGTDGARVNGDGFADLVVGAFSDFSQVGSIYMYPGGPAGLSESSQPIVIAGPDGQSSNFGETVASAGDLNGDGYADVLVGALGVGKNAGIATGGVHIYFGAPSGLTPSSRIDLNSPDGGLFGSSVASAGDVNGDGYPDFVIGAINAQSDTGRAYLYLGGASGVSANQAATTVLNGPGGANGLFGAATNAGDLNGDGYADLTIGDRIGHVYVYYGGAQGISSNQQPTPLGGSPELSGAGDINTDGYADFISGNAVFLGSSAGVSMARSVVLTNPDIGGGAAAGIGDINGDGYADVATTNDGVLDCLGRAYIYLGSAAGFTTTQQPIILTGPDIDDEFGISIATRLELSAKRQRC